jgi:hypothetical protein
VKQRQKAARKGQLGRVSVRDMGQIDGRLRASKALMQWRSELERDLGGDLSAQQRTLIELCCRNRLFLDSLDVYLVSLPSLVNKRKRTALPALATRMQLSESLARLLMQLGLEKRMPAAPDLRTYLANKYGHDEADAQSESDDTGSKADAETPAATPEGESKE